MNMLKYTHAHMHTNMYTNTPSPPHTNKYPCLYMHAKYKLHTCKHVSIVRTYVRMYTHVRTWNPPHLFDIKRLVVWIHVPPELEDTFKQVSLLELQGLTGQNVKERSKEVKRTSFQVHLFTFNLDRSMKGSLSLK